MAEKQLITVFGATGNQGGSIINVILSHPDLSEKYALRGISRNPMKASSKILTAQGVEMVAADLNDPESLLRAVHGSYGVFGMTDFWSSMSKQTEIQQGKNIVNACKTANVKHLVFSSLPNVEKLTKGVLRHVDHFDSKATVQEYAESVKGDMLASYCLPAMFLTFVRRLIHVIDGTPTLIVPFPSANIAWPLHDPKEDAGKYVVALFEGGEAANGVQVQGVSTWTTPQDVVDTICAVAGTDVVFKCVSAEDFSKALPENIREEITETLLLIGDYSYYGIGAEHRQSESAEWLLPQSKLMTFERFVEENGPWEF